MADKFTTTETVGAKAADPKTDPKKTPAKKKDDDPNAAVNDAIEALREALLDSGLDEATVDAKLHSVQPAETNIVGNFADLQRLGAQQVHETGGISDAFPAPPDPPTENEEKSAGEVK